MRESAVEKRLRDATTKRGGLCWKFVSPGRAGVPDRIVILPDCPAAFVEVKAPGKRPTAQQEIRHQQIRARGALVFTLDHPDQIGGVLDAIQTTRLPN